MNQENVRFLRENYLIYTKGRFFNTFLRWGQRYIILFKYTYLYCNNYKTLGNKAQNKIFVSKKEHFNTTKPPY